MVGTYKIFFPCKMESPWKTTGGRKFYQNWDWQSVEKGQATGGIFSVQPHSEYSSISQKQIRCQSLLKPRFWICRAKNQSLITRMMVSEQYLNRGAEVTEFVYGNLSALAEQIPERKELLHSLELPAAEPIEEVSRRWFANWQRSLRTNPGWIPAENCSHFLNLIIYWIEKCIMIAGLQFTTQSLSSWHRQRHQSTFCNFCAETTQRCFEFKSANLRWEEHFRKISFENLSNRFAVGRRNFDRRFIKNRQYACWISATCKNWISKKYVWIYRQDGKR